MAGTLLLVHRIPWPPDRGDKIRSHHWLRALAGRGPLHVGCFYDDPADARWVGDIARMATSVHAEPRHGGTARHIFPAVTRGLPLSVAAFRSRTMQAWVGARLAEGIDRIVVYSGQMAYYLPSRFAGRVIVDFVDADSAKFADYSRTASAPLALAYRREARLLGAFEGAVARRADAVMLVSAEEAALFDALHGTRGTMAVGNGVDAAWFDPGAGIRPVVADGARATILFVGQMDYPPNVDAVMRFTRDVMPLVRTQWPGTRFVICGRAPGHGVRALAGPDVHVTGTVPDVRPWLAAADCVVAPLAIARGVQNKVLEAMAMARPVVASTAAATGIGATDGRDLLIADDAAGMARAIGGLFGDPARAAAIGAAARAHVVAHHDWRAAQARFLAVCDGTAS